MIVLDLKNVDCAAILRQHGELAAVWRHGLARGETLHRNRESDRSVAAAVRQPRFERSGRRGDPKRTCANRHERECKPHFHAAWFRREGVRRPCPRGLNYIKLRLDKLSLDGATTLANRRSRRGPR